ncbi:hypothetical protein DFR70_105164 [Nocardia tenerifensis]|uniref:Lipoprotein n=1 Tax=Nocardia tenerifensis TaxID=228006 RepID=A0A318JZ19_9NOCA|nr:hypothetical protein [Nocardia tenerifensis]PXX63982.1 hypothetical protein DFR70_105164 [Nocardia tenerifensis]
MRRHWLGAALVCAVLAVPGCGPANTDGRSAEPDAGAIDRVLESPATQQLAASFLRSQQAPADDVALRRSGPDITVYATNPRFVTDPQSPLRDAGTPAYIAVPAMLSARNAPDTVQLTPTPPFTPRAIATGTEETEAAQSLPAGARLLLDYPSHTWLAWSETRVTAISSGTRPELKGREFDAGQFREWLASR